MGSTFYKIRSLTSEETDKGRVHINGVPVKLAREVKAGDLVACCTGQVARTVTMLAVSDKRSLAPQAARLYQETAQSVQLRQQAAEG